MSKVTDEAEVRLLNSLPPEQREDFEHYFKVKLLESRAIIFLIVYAFSIAIYMAAVI